MKIPTSLLLSGLAGTLLLTSACAVRHREDVRTVDYAVPGLAGPECSKALLSVLSRTGGVIEATPDLANRKVSVTYNSRETAQKNLEHAIAAAGFDVEDTPGDPVAKDKLPANCR